MLFPHYDLFLSPFFRPLFVRHGFSLWMFVFLHSLYVSEKNLTSFFANFHRYMSFLSARLTHDHFHASFDTLVHSRSTLEIFDYGRAYASLVNTCRRLGDKATKFYEKGIFISLEVGDIAG